MAKRKTAEKTLVDHATIIPEGYTYRELRSLVATTLLRGISVLVRGHPGVGKSTLARELAESMNLHFIDIRLAQRDPAEIGGVYFPDRDKGVLDLLPPAWVREACDRPSFVFLDEINAAVTKLHQAVAYQIVLEKRIGQFKFHAQTVVMGAGNLEEDRAIVTPLSTALANRFAHYILRVDEQSWLAWGAAAGLPGSLLAYIAHAGRDALYENTGEMAFPTPRSWEYAGRLLEHGIRLEQKRLVSACVGEAAAEKFFSYLRLFGRVDAESVIRHGKMVDFAKRGNTEPSFIYAATFAVADYVKRNDDLDEAHLHNVVRFLETPGLEPEFQMLFLRQIKHRGTTYQRLKPLAGFRTVARRLVSLRRGLFDAQAI